MAMFLVDGLNVHNKFKMSVKKPFGGKNSFVNRTISKPGPALIGLGLGGPLGAVVGAGIRDMNANTANKKAEHDRQQQAAADQAAAAAGDLEAMARLEEQKRKDLGIQQRGQINTFADETAARAKDFRGGLAKSLSDSGSAFFNRMNPAILEDLNSRGLFTSQTARDQEQTQALGDIERENQGALTRFDTDIFGQLQDIRGTGLSAQLGGDQSALDSALSLRKAGIQRRFDEADAAREQNFAEMLARRQRRDQLTGALIGLGGGLGSAAILCFDPSTLIEMGNGDIKEIGSVYIGDVLSDGGFVISVRDALIGDGHFFEYKGVKVTGYHAVKEDGIWIRVKDSLYTKALFGGGPIRTLGTSTHRLFISGIEFSDELETDDFNKISLDESLALLNSEMVAA